MTPEITSITWLGAFLLAVCGIPQAWRAYRCPETARGLSWGFLTAWGLGEVLMGLGMAPIASLPVLANYTVNAGLIGYLMIVKWQLPRLAGPQ